eukprot:COSAG04_NODE_1721_length_5810_cov_3.177377_2_plen_78_part_00
MGFRQNVTTGVAVDDEPETIYMVTSGTHYNGHCCFVRLSSAPLPTATTTRPDDVMAVVDRRTTGMPRWASGPTPQTT